MKNVALFFAVMGFTMLSCAIQKDEIQVRRVWCHLAEINYEYRLNDNHEYEKAAYMIWVDEYNTRYRQSLERNETAGFRQVGIGEWILVTR